MDADDVAYCGRMERSLGLHYIYILTQICGRMSHSATPIPTLNHPKTPPTPPKHLIQIPHQRLRPLMRRKMPPVLMQFLKNHRPQRPPPAPRRHAEVPGEIRQSEFDAREVRGEGGAVEVGGVGGFVVDAEAGGGAGGREVVERDPGEDLGVGPGVGVGPVVEFFVDPAEEGEGAVG